jgi:hypothetical protein
MTFLKVNCLVLNPELGDGKKTQDKTTLVLVNLNVIDAIEEDKESHYHEGKNLSMIQLKGNSRICVIGSVEEIAHKIETDKGRFVVDLTAPKSE